MKKKAERRKIGVILTHFFLFLLVKNAFIEIAVDDLISKKKIIKYYIRLL